jgi:hypothetical protein
MLMLGADGFWASRHTAVKRRGIKKNIFTGWMATWGVRILKWC